MLKKEIHAVLRYTLYWLAILVFQVLLFAATGWLEPQGAGIAARASLLLGPQMLLLVYPMLLGLSLFSEESQQKGMEYLLSLPYTRLQIVRTKLLVRLAALILVFIPFFSLFNANPFHSTLFPVLIFSIVYFVLFVISFSVSGLQENSIIGFLLTLFFSVFYLLSVCLVYFAAFALAGPADDNILTLRDLLGLEKAGDITMNLNIPQWSFWLILFLMLLPFLAAFFRMARNLDLRQARRKKTFTWTFGLLMPLAFLASVGLFYATFDWSEYTSYYLTSGKNLLEMRWTGTMRIYEPKGSKKIFIPGQLFAEVLGEKAGRVYINSWQREGEKLLQLQEKNGEWQSLYQCPDGFQLGWSSGTGIFDQDIFILEMPESKQGALYLLIVDALGRKLRRVKFSELQEPRSYQMIGAGNANGKKFVLISSILKRYMPVQRLWEDGHAEKLAGTEHLLSLYLGGKLLISGKEGVKVFGLTATDQPKLEKTLPDLIIPGWYRWRGRDEFDLSAALAVKEVLLTSGGSQYSALNLQTFAQKLISPTSADMALHALSWPFFRTTMYNEFSILRIQDGQLATLGSLRFQFHNVHDQAWFDNGIVTRQNKKVRAYAFPDLRELIFPDL